MKIYRTTTTLPRVSITKSVSTWKILYQMELLICAPLINALEENRLVDSRSEIVERLTRSSLDLACRSSGWKTKRLMYKFRLTRRTRRVTRSNNRTRAIHVLMRTNRSNGKNFEMKEKSDGSTKEENSSHMPMAFNVFAPKKCSIMPKTTAGRW